MATAAGISSWQTGKNLKECLEHVFLTRTHTDVRFLVGEHKTAVDAHRFILIIRSEVFHQMMTGELREQSNITIPDVQAEIFSEFLKYLYTDDVVLKGDNVIGLLYLSRKYIITTLEDQCTKYLESSLSSQNACVVLEQAHLFDEHDLRKKTLDFILENGDEVLKSDEVTDLCHESLVEIVRSDELAADEKNVFEAAVKWADSACRKQGKTTSEKNMREALGEVVKHVRYPLLDHTYFVKHVTPTHILTETEAFKILKNLASSDEDISPFNSNIRTAIMKTQITINRFDVFGALFRVFGFFLSCFGKEDDAITFSVNKNALLRGFQLYGDLLPRNYDISAFVTDTRTDEILDGSTLKQRYEHVMPDVYDVVFRRPVKITKDTEYSLFVNINGGDSLRGREGKSEIVVDSFVCRFSESHESKHSDRQLRTGVTEGQIPALLFLV